VWPQPSTPLLFRCTDSSPSEFYTLSLHDALPISAGADMARLGQYDCACGRGERRRGRLGSSAGLVDDPHGLARAPVLGRGGRARSEEHTSELQSRENLVCRLLLEEKKLQENQRVV